LGFALAYLLYCKSVISPAAIKEQLKPLHSFLVAKWRFDELYDAVFVWPSKRVGGFIAGIDRNVFDNAIDGLAASAVKVAKSNRRFDEVVVDGAVRASGEIVSALARTFRVIQTGRARQYVLFVAVGLVLVVAGFFGVILPH